MKKRSMRSAPTRPSKKIKGRRARSDEMDMQLFDADFAAKTEGPRKKTWSVHDLIPLRPKNDKQADAITNWIGGDNLALLGSTGTGKTVLSVYLALSALLRKDDPIEKIIIVRSAVQGRDLGFLPGDLEEKLAAYEQPYILAFQKCLGRASSYKDMKEAGLVEFHSTSFLRGVTFDNAVVLLDEAQNCEFRELDTVLSRLGEDSRLVIMGDTRQLDLDKRQPSGLPVFKEIVKDMKGFAVIEFNRYDIVRSGFVRSWIIASENYLESQELERKRNPNNLRIVS